jgi:hypothetical protein
MSEPIKKPYIDVEITASSEGEAIELVEEYVSTYFKTCVEELELEHTIIRQISKSEDCAALKVEFFSLQHWYIENKKYIPKKGQNLCDTLLKDYDSSVMQLEHHIGKIDLSGEEKEIHVIRAVVAFAALKCAKIRLENPNYREKNIDMGAIS